MQLFQLLNGSFLLGNVSIVRKLFIYIKVRHIKEVLKPIHFVLLNVSNCRSKFWQMNYLQLRTSMQMFYVLCTLVSLTLTWHIIPCNL
jgi:hypothetical protein